MAQINPYLSLNGKTREAMNFYKECFGGELTLQPIEGTPMESQCPAAMKHQIMHSMLQSGNLLLFASDMSGPGGVVQGTSVSLALNCSSEEEINQFFTYLSAGGKIIEPIRDQFWGAKFGCVKDKYEIIWMLNYSIDMPAT